MDAFSQFLECRQETISAFARRIGRAPSTLTRALSGERRPSDDLAAAVAIGTDGAVSEEAFLLICLAARKARAAVDDDMCAPQDADRVSTAGPVKADLSGPALSPIVEAAE